jgi:hypothetical protein
MTEAEPLWAGPHVVGCRSGRSGRSRKPLCPRGYRGFESHPHRQHFFRNVRKSERGFGYPRNGNAVTGEQIDEYVGALSAPA